jgi:uncharacterized protein (TIGR03435 family)
MRKLIACCWLISVLPQMSLAQKPSFEVATVKPSRYESATYLLWPPGRFSAINVSVRDLLEFAYRVGPHAALPKDQILGGPSWINTDRFDIEAKPEGAAGKEAMQVMMQSLLETRFQLKTHVEIRELPVYNLTVGKTGPKLKPSADQNPANSGTVGTTGSSSGTALVGTAVPLSAVVRVLQTQAGRPIVDKTDLKGLYDIDLQFNRSPASELEAESSEESGPSLFAAVKRLGLKLESAKALLEVVVIDSIQKPTEN